MMHVSFPFTKDMPLLEFERLGLSGPVTFNLPLLLVVVVLLFSVYIVGNAVYSVTLHPLAKFPGPTFAGMSDFAWWKASLTGEQVNWLRALHAKYGGVVRFRPGHLSYADKRAWREVQGFGYEKGRKENHKVQDILPPKNGVHSIVTADLEDHRRVRRLFSPAFSDRALKAQEGLFFRHADLMVTKLGEACNRGEKIDLAKIFEFVIFDIMGDLLLGAPLGLLENSKYSPWVQAVHDSLRPTTLLHMIYSYPISRKIFELLEPKSIIDMKEAHFRHTADRVDARQQRGSDQPDIWNLVNQGLTVEEMHSNADFFMLAGTETSASLLAAWTYYLCMNPDMLKRVTDQIRTTFQSSSDIEMMRLAGLKYLNATLQEALRMYPPVPAGLWRVVPEGGQIIMGSYVPAGTRLSVDHTAMYCSPNYFFNPDKYDPERWLPPTDTVELAAYPYKDDHRDAHQPFSWGHRDCIGKNMAWHEMRLLAAKLLFSFDVEVCEESKDWSNQKVYALWEKKPLFCRLRTVARE